MNNSLSDFSLLDFMPAQKTKRKEGKRKGSSETGLDRKNKRLRNDRSSVRAETSATSKDKGKNEDSRKETAGSTV